MSSLSFARGETTVRSEKFSPSVVLFWLKSEIAVTNMRVVSKSPNTLLGLIPLGYKDATFPLPAVASVGVEVKFSVGRAIFGLIFSIIGLNILNNLFGWILLIIGLSMLLNALSAVLKIQNNGGAISELRVSILEKSKLEQLRSEIDNSLFADHAGIRHQENMDLGRANLIAQETRAYAQQAHLEGQHKQNPGQLPPVSGQ